MSGTITLTAEQVPPDYVAALVARLRRFTNLLTLCADQTYTVTGRTKKVKRIAAELQAIPEAKGWQGHAVVVKDAGGYGPDPAVPFDTPRVDCLCYGSTGLEAAKVARLVVAALDPVSRYGRGFTEVECAVQDVRQVSGLLPLYDKGNRAHVRAVTFEVRYCQVPVIAEAS